MWLAVASVLMHALIPNHFMFGRSGSAHTFGLVICTGAMTSATEQAVHVGIPTSNAHKVCPFAAAAMHGLTRYGLAIALAHQTLFLPPSFALPVYVPLRIDPGPPATGPPKFPL